MAIIKVNSVDRFQSCRLGRRRGSRQLSCTASCLPPRPWRPKGATATSPLDQGTNGLLKATLCSFSVTEWSKKETWQWVLLGDSKFNFSSNINNSNKDSNSSQFTQFRLLYVCLLLALAAAAAAAAAAVRSDCSPLANSSRRDSSLQLGRCRARVWIWL